MIRIHELDSVLLAFYWLGRDGKAIVSTTRLTCLNLICHAINSIVVLLFDLGNEDYLEEVMISPPSTCRLIDESTLP